MAEETGDEKLRRYRKDPVAFVREQFGVEPDRWQVKALMAFASWDRELIRISLQACAGPGKSAVLAWCGWNFLVCYAEEGEHPKGAAVSISWDNLKDNLWVELAKWQQKSPMLTELFTWTQTRIYANDHKETWFLSARSFPKGADSETMGKTLSGVHSKYVLFLIDESGAVPPEIGKAAEQAVGETLGRGGFCKILQAGNPISLDGMLYSASTSNDWHVIRITGDPNDPDRSPRIDINWAKEQIGKYGIDDPWVMSYLLGRFPKTSINSLLSVDEVEDAMNRHLRADEYGYAQKRLGVDVARGGLDSTVIFPRQGLAAFKYVQMRGANGPDVAARVMEAKGKWGSEMEFVDDTGGFGSSVIDSLQMAGFTPNGIHFSGKAIKERYFNKRSEMWHEMAEWVKRGGVLPKCSRLKKELTAVTYTLKNGKLALEEKDQIKKRLGFSPDIADALALTFALPDMPARTEYERLDRSNKANKVKHEWDPFAEKVQ
jgi:phage terminase large subunit